MKASLHLVAKFAVILLISSSGVGCFSVLVSVEEGPVRPGPSTRTYPDAALVAPDGRVLSTDAAPDVPRVPSRAGLPCIDDTMCGILTCDTTVAMGICTGMCNNGSAASEAAQCGGSGGTCVSIGDEPMSTTLCTKSCRATAASGCRPGYVCTGFWYTHAGAMPDAPGCMPQCSDDLHCNAGERCNVRTGACGMMGSDPTKLADGQACTLPAMGEPSPCRGICFTVSSTDRTRGVCGSFIDLSTVMECPDDPMNVQPLGRMGADNKGLCIFLSCSATNCCPEGMTCQGAAGAADGTCSPVRDPIATVIACTGSGDAGEDSGVRDAAMSPSDALTDATASDHDAVSISDIGNIDGE